MLCLLLDMVLLGNSADRRFAFLRLYVLKERKTAFSISEFGEEASATCEPAMCRFLQFIPQLISQQDNDTLLRPVSLKEVEEAGCELGPGKAVTDWVACCAAWNWIGESENNCLLFYVRFLLFCFYSLIFLSLMFRGLALDKFLVTSVTGLLTDLCHKAKTPMKGIDL